jgi:hypothetical protein
LNLGAKKRLLPVLGIVLLASSLGRARGAAPRTFDVHTLPVRGKLLEAAVVRDENGTPTVIIAVSAPEKGDDSGRQLTPFRLPDLKPGEPVDVPPDAVLFDVSDVRDGGGEEIVFLCTGSVTALSLSASSASPELAEILEVKTFFDRPQNDALYRHRFCLDLSGDGKTDLLVPQHYGYVAAFREGEGFGRMNTLSLSGKNKMVRFTHEVFQLNFAAQRSTLPVLKAVDFDGDGRRDLLALADKRLTAFLGGEGGRFTVKPSFSMSLPFFAPATGEPEEDVFEGKRVFLEEIDGNGHVDLIVVRTQGKVGLFSSIRTRVELFLGRPGAFPGVPRPR